MRLLRMTDEKWRRLAAAQRAGDLDGAPPRTEIGAIEIELRALQDDPALTPLRESAAG
jgi:hypothetical protein